MGTGLDLRLQLLPGLEADGPRRGDADRLAVAGVAALAGAAALDEEGPEALEAHAAVALEAARDPREDGADGPVPIVRWPRDTWTPVAAAFLDACVALGFDECPDHNAPHTTGVGPIPMNRVDRRRISNLLAYLEPARGRPNLTVRADAHVRRVLVVQTGNGRRATGVELVDGTVLTAGEVPRGTTVLGVDIGGMSKTAAASKLRTALRGKANQPVSLKYEGKTFTAMPADIGLSVDVEGTAARAADRAVNPIAVLKGSTKVDPVIKIDKTLLRAGTLDDTAADSTEMVRPAITYEGLTPKPLYGKQGSGVDLPAAMRALRAGWLRPGTIQLPKGKVLPETSDAELNNLVRAVAGPAVSGPVKVELPQKSFDITPQQIASSLTFLSDEQGAVHPKVDPKKPATALDGQLRSVGTPAADATVKVVNGALKTTSSQAGVGVNTETLAQELLPVLQAARIPGGPVIHEDEAYRDPQLEARGFFVPVTHPEIGTHRYPSTTFKMSKLPFVVRKPPIRLGEDNEYIYKQVLGKTQDEYDQLVAEGHIGMDYDPSVR